MHVHTWMPRMRWIFAFPVSLDISIYVCVCVCVYARVCKCARVVFFRWRFLPRFASFCFHPVRERVLDFLEEVRTARGRRVAAGGEERKVNYGRRKISGTCSCEKLVRVAVDDSSLFSFFRPPKQVRFYIFSFCIFFGRTKKGMWREGERLA